MTETLDPDPIDGPVDSGPIDGPVGSGPIDGPVDLGVVDGPVLLFGGPYSNLQATEAMLETAADLGFAAERVVCTGDVVAYGGDPAATTEAVMRSGIHVVMGNCEESIGAEAGDCGCGFEEGSACDQLSVAWYAHAAAALDETQRAWMRALPRRIDLTLGGVRLSVVHGAVTDISRFVFASTPAADKHREFEALASDSREAPAEVIVGGHCGLPFTDDLGFADGPAGLGFADGPAGLGFADGPVGGNARLWHNPGVIGLPANDGTPRGWYSVLAADDGGLAIEHRALAFDHDEAAVRIDRAGLPGAYAETLLSGLWPNMDVLPETERLGRGRPIQPSRLSWSPRPLFAAE